MTDNILHLRMINGEEIVADVITETKNTVVVDNPLIVEERKDENGSTLVLTKYIPFAKEKVCELLKSHIITMTEIHPELVRYYYNSLKFNNNSEMKMVDEIARVNLLMEQIMSDQSLDIDLKRVTKSSNSLH